MCYAKSLQLCPTLCNAMEYSPPVSFAHGIHQTRILEWVECPPPGELPDSGIKPLSLVSPALAGGFFITMATWEAQKRVTSVCVCTHTHMHVCVLVAQSCPTLFNPMAYRPSGSSVHGILEARILEWVAIPFSRDSFQPRNLTQVSCISCTAGKFFYCLSH